MKIVQLDGYALNPGDISMNDFSALGEFITFPRTAVNEVVERLKDADAVLTNKVQLTSEVLQQLPKLKYIGVMATGYNVVDIDAAKRLGIVVTNIPAYSTDSVAQMVFAHILNISNHVAHYAQQNRAGRWSRNPDFCYWDTPLFELNGKNMGIVGLGHIGSRVATIARDFNMNVYAFTSKSADVLPSYIHKVDFSELLAASDILTLHCPLTDSTKHLINDATLAKMRKGAILINTSRGGVIDEDAVARALQNGTLLAFGADVLTSEPPAADNALLQQPNAYITPHIAWASVETRKRLVDIAVNNLRQFIAGKPVNVVNA